MPFLKSSSIEYEQLFREALNRLWNIITDSGNVQIIRAAIRALKNFDFAELNLQYIPSLLFDNIKLPKEYQIQIGASQSDLNAAPLTAVDVVPYIPGEVWIELLKTINQNALDEAIEFVAHSIETEMSQYRSGVYITVISL